MMTDPTYEAWREIRRDAAGRFSALADAYMADLPDLSRLRWVRHGFGKRAQSPTGELRDNLHTRLVGAIHRAALDAADRTGAQYDDPAILEALDMEGLWTGVLADATEADATHHLVVLEREDEQERILAEMGDPTACPGRTIALREPLDELLGLVRAWRTGGPVPQRLIVGANAAAERVGLTASDVRARMARGHFATPDDTRAATYGQTSPAWWADTLDAWWERKPARGPARTVRPSGL